MYEFQLDDAKCERCFDCVTACPRGVLEEGPNAPVVARPEECMGCMVCLAVCRPQGLKVLEVNAASRPTSIAMLQLATAC